MKKMALVIALAAFAMSGAAFAQDPGYADNFGIYMDEAATVNCATIAPGVPVPAYMVLTKLSTAGIKGVEVKINHTSNILALDVLGRGDAVEVVTGTDEVVIAYAVPLLAVGGTVVAADLNVLPLDGNPAALFVAPIFYSLLDNGLPAFVDENDVGHSLYPATSLINGAGSINDPIFIANGACEVVADEAVSFGAVKGLFR